MICEDIFYMTNIGVFTHLPFPIVLIGVFFFSKRRARFNYMSSQIT